MRTITGRGTSSRTKPANPTYSPNMHDQRGNMQDAKQILFKTRSAAISGSLLLMAFVFLIVLPAQLTAAVSVTLQWDENATAPQGYRLFQREEGQNYDYSKWAYQGEKATCNIDNLTEGVTYYFVSRAFSGEIQSSNSNEVRFTPPASSGLSPLADAGSSLEVLSLGHVTLDGSGCTDPEGGGLSYQWNQTAGPTVHLSNSGVEKPAFTAPEISEGSIQLRFELTVTNEKNLSASDTCLVQVSALLDETDTDGDGTPDAVDGDDDGDGMPDEWEIKYGLDPLDSSDASLDADDDGITNLKECQESTDPLVAAGNQTPNQPVVISPENGDTLVDLSPILRASKFRDPDKTDTHLKTQWLVQTADGQQVVFQAISTDGRLKRLRMPRFILDPGTDYAAQVRYYDNHDLASEWSLPVTFATKADDGDQNKDGIPDDQEVIAKTDLNNDNVPDGDQKEHLKRFRNYYNGIMGVSIVSDDSATSIQAAAEIDPLDLDESTTTHFLSDESMPYGTVGYKIRVATPGQSTRVHIYLSDPVDAQTPWVRYDSAKGWVDCTDEIQLDDSGTIAEQDVVDGGSGDADGVANGTIVDIVAPKTVVDGGLSLSDGSGSSVASTPNSTCFIQSLF